MPYNLTPKQEKFCLEYLKTGNASEAYRQSYDYKKMKPESVNRAAKQLLDNAKIATRIQELKKPAIKKAQMTLEDHLEDLRILRNRATKEGKLDAAIKAEIARGRHSGVAAADKIAPVNTDGTPYTPVAAPLSPDAEQKIRDAFRRSYSTTDNGNTTPGT